MTDGFNIGSLVHERQGGPTMTVTGVTDAAAGRFVHLRKTDGSELTRRAEDLRVLVPVDPRGDR